MKAYICDACGASMKNPYEARMKEFCVRAHFDLGMVFPEPTTQKKQVHLCQRCWENLSHLFDKERTEKKPDVLYLCDGDACEKCDSENCRHTTDVRFAKNFKRIDPFSADCYEEVEK